MPLLAKQTTIWLRYVKYVGSSIDAVGCGRCIRGVLLVDLHAQGRHRRVGDVRPLV
jgi:hypothetical protein